MSTANVIDPIIPKSLMDSLKEAFSIQASTQAEVVKVSTVEPQTLPPVDLISAIGLRSSTVAGTLALCFSSTTFLGILNKMLGEKYTEVTPENSDAASELLNIVYASARVKMNQAGHDFTPAIPTTTRGKNIQISHGGSTKIIRLDCKSEFGEFYLEVSLKRISK